MIVTLSLSFISNLNQALLSGTLDYLSVHSGYTNIDNFILFFTELSADIYLHKIFYTYINNPGLKTFSCEVHSCTSFR